jgi:SAM-dependent methyltransferase
MAVYGLDPGARVVEIGAGTGIATLPLIDCGFQVTAVEPAVGMATLLEAKVGPRAQVIVRPFEETTVQGPVDMIAAFNSWHWVDPVRGVRRLTDMLSPGGLVAFVWTEVVSWGEDPFGERLADVSGRPWNDRLPEIVNTKDVVATDGRFTTLDPRRYRFQRELDAHAFVEVTRTYGGHLSDDLVVEIEAVINNDFEGKVTKVEEAVVHAYRRL